MNNQLIDKVIKTNNEQCPDFVFDNPILDRKVARALSRSFIKILKVYNQHSNINSNLRHSVLENIRKMCRVESKNHLKVDENFTALLTEIYRKNFEKSRYDGENSTDKLLDAFLAKRFKESDVNTRAKSTFNLETVQAVINLSENGAQLETLSKDVIYWNPGRKKCLKILQDMWRNSNVTDSSVSEVFIDDISVKLKPEIERLLLEYCYRTIKEDNINLEIVFTTDETLVILIKTCAISSECFQMCSCILNFMFVATEFSLKILNFISTFVSHVKLYCTRVAFSTLYSTHLSNLVALIDIDLDEIPDTLKGCYIKMVVPHLQSLQLESENDLILMLSHFPVWFDIFFENL